MKKIKEIGVFFDVYDKNPHYVIDFMYLCTQIQVYLKMENKGLNRIKVMLVEKNKTAKWLAKELGKDPTTVSKWCTNQSQPTLEILIKIADLLEVDYTELVRVETKP